MYHTGSLHMEGSSTDSSLHSKVSVYDDTFETNFCEDVLCPSCTVPLLKSM